jgi:putative transcriptional regulator
MADAEMNPRLFNELVGALDEAVAFHRGAKLDLRTTTLPEPPARVTRAAVKRLRAWLEVSQPVFAHCLNVSTKLVQAWEGGQRPVEGPALTLLRLAEQHPELVFPLTGRAASSAPRARGHAPPTVGRLGLAKTAKKRRSTMSAPKHRGAVKRSLVRHRA